MKNRQRSISAMSVMWAALLALAGSFASAANPLTPETAAKREVVRKQREQQVTPTERKAAADWLKAERVRVFNAKQAALKSNPGQGK